MSRARLARALLPELTAAAIVGGAVAFALQVTAPEPASKPSAEPPPAAAARAPLPFTVQARSSVLEEHGSYPCKECHDESLPTDAKERAMPEDHGDIDLKHGGGRFWCLTCHDADNRDVLHGLKGQPITFDEPFLLCGQCHFRRQRDFFFGAHGKRVGTWQGERVLTPCTACHNAHDPSIKPRKPYRAERLRAGLQAERRGHARLIEPATVEGADERQ